ncbi:hypothetical protein H6P81_013692 [Aristolochia fimbriata]|uniref:Uncharacterized protein n=1 Tax=Aristolochia fimbriata TaxID=158543 RepID=A0AAV7EH17_ARIFI|nr:hypothetical protein H6P81_013692 [Aristolochia fimbriata]
MEDERVVNGAEAVDEPAADGVLGKDVNVEMNDEVSNLKHKNEVLAKENSAQSEKIMRMTLEIEGFNKNKSEMEQRLELMEKEIEQSEKDKRILESVAARAADLETEVVRLQHDLVSSMSESEENAAEVSELKFLCEGLRRSHQEKDSKIGDLEKTKAEMEIRIRTLEENLSVVDAQKKNIQEEATAKEEKIRLLSLKIDEMSIDLKKLQEKTGKHYDLKLKVDQLLKELNDLKAKNSKIENQKADFEKKALELEQEKLESKDRVLELERGLQLQRECTNFSWPVAAALTGTVAATGMLYLAYANKR